MGPRDDRVRFPFGESLDGDSMDGLEDSQDGERPTDTGEVRDLRRDERPTDTGPVDQSSSEIRSPLRSRPPLDSAEGPLYLDSGEEPIYEDESSDPWSDMAAPRVPEDEFASDVGKVSGRRPAQQRESLPSPREASFYDSMDDFVPNDLIESQESLRGPGPIGLGSAAFPPEPKRPRPKPKPQPRPAPQRPPEPAAKLPRPLPPPTPSGKRVGPQLGQDCPRCRMLIPRGPQAVACPDCGTRYHVRCALALGGCATPGCPRTVANRQKRAIETGKAPGSARLPAPQLTRAPTPPPRLVTELPPVRRAGPRRSVAQRFSNLPRELTQSAQFNARALQRTLEKISGIGEISGTGRVRDSDLGDTASDYGSVHELARTASDVGLLDASDSRLDTVGFDDEPAVARAPRRPSRRAPRDDPAPADDEASFQMFESDEGELTPVVAAASSVGMVLDASDEDDSEEVFASSGATPALAGTPSARVELPSGGRLERLIERSIQRVVRLWTGDGMWFLLGMGALIVGPLLMFQDPARDFYFVFSDEGIPSIRPKGLRSGRPLEHMLQPGGKLGLWFGIIGAALFLTNLTYVLRRRFSLFSRWIGLRTWLNVHAVTGLLGASLILVHSSLLFNNIPAVISFAGIMVAVCSGIFGRYVILHLPRFADGHDDVSARQRELEERQDAAERLGELRRQLRIALADHPKLRDAACDALAANKGVQPRGIRYLGRLLLGDWLALARTRRLTRELKTLLKTTKGKEARQALLDTLALIKNQSALERRLAEAPAVRDLMDTWRGLHFILALVAIMFMFLHIALILPFTRLSDALGG